METQKATRGEIITLIIVGAIIVYFGAWSYGKMRDARATTPQYKCVEGYKFTKDGRKQILNENGGGISCSDNFVLPNTLGVR